MFCLCLYAAWATAGLHSSRLRFSYSDTVCGSLWFCFQNCRRTGLYRCNAKSDTLMPVIKQKIMPDSIVYTDSLSSYDKLDVSGFIHYRINHSKEFADRQNHINGIENFWNQAKRVLRKYNGIDRKSFPLFLKECEFRFNFGTPSQQLKILRDWCGI